MGWKDELARLRDTADKARQKVGELADRAVAELREAEERAREHPSTLTGLAVEIRDSVQRAISEAADSVETALEPDEIGESMHREICAHFLVDDRLGAQRARGICDRLNEARALAPVVVWGKFPTAVAGYLWVEEYINGLAQ